MPCEAQNGHQGGQRCLMCLNSSNPVFLWQCGRNHHYCMSCTDILVDNTLICPECKNEGVLNRDQPTGSMVWFTVVDTSLTGFDNCGIISTNFKFDEGIQGTIK